MSSESETVFVGDDFFVILAASFHQMTWNQRSLRLRCAGGDAEQVF